MLLNFTVDFLSKNIRRSLLSTFLITVSSLVIMLAVILAENREKVYESIDILFNAGVSNTSKLSIDFYYDDDISLYDDISRESLKAMNLKIDDFLDDISDEPEIASIGSFSTAGCIPIPELYEIQKKGGANSGVYLTMTDVTKSAIDMFNLEVIEGTPCSEVKFEDGINYLYLGYGYKGLVEPGTIYEIETYKFKVAGILDEKQVFLDGDFVSGISIAGYSVTHDMKYEILCFSDSAFTSGYWLCANEGYDIEQAIDKVYEVAEKHDVDQWIRYTTLNDTYEMANEEWVFIKNIISKLIIIVCTSCILMLICTHILDLLHQMRNYGIMYANGFSMTDIYKIITLKNIAISIFAFLISIIITILAVNVVFKGYENMNDVFNRIIINISVPLALAVISVITVFVTLFSILILRKLSPLRMIGGQND